jgi:hypothetical protein
MRSWGEEGSRTSGEGVWAEPERLATEDLAQFLPRLQCRGPRDAERPGRKNDHAVLPHGAQMPAHRMPAEQSKDRFSLRPAVVGHDDDVRVGGEEKFLAELRPGTGRLRSDIVQTGGPEDLVRVCPATYAVGGGSAPKSKTAVREGRTPSGAGS